MADLLPTIDSFQFPVGMSNKSYFNLHCLLYPRPFGFQFPVGMSNKSYTKAVGAILKEMEIPFNSPWECRISLTLISCVRIIWTGFFFQFPVGMSNKSYVFAIGIVEGYCLPCFQFPVGMSNKSY